MKYTHQKLGVRVTLDTTPAVENIRRQLGFLFTALVDVPKEPEMYKNVDELFEAERKSYNFYPAYVPGVSDDRRIERPPYGNTLEDDGRPPLQWLLCRAWCLTTSAVDRAFTALENVLERHPASKDDGADYLRSLHKERRAHGSGESWQGRPRDADEDVESPPFQSLPNDEAE